jgi:predicted extracellular nuclease
VPSPQRLALSGLATATLVVTGLTYPLATATAVSTDIVISEVYGGGGNSGATWKNDFVELYNAGDEAVDLSGWSVQYASATGTSWQRTNLSGTVAPGGYYLVQEARGSGGSQDLPTPDASGGISMSGTSGKVALVHGTTTLSGCGADCSVAPTVHDFVGFGSANDFEGTASAGTLSNTTSANRDSAGTDTDRNNVDFQVGEPTPKAEADIPPSAPGLKVHDIQGAAHLSPYAGRRVLDVPGVVTATNDGGFWMQSTSPDSSDATSEGIYVYRGDAHVGDVVNVTGDVTEFRPGSASGTNLTTTELVSLNVDVVSSGNALPDAVDIGTDRVPPTEVIDNDTTGSVEWSDKTTFDPDEDGIDFYESMEGMRVSVTDPEVVGPTASFEEIPVVVGGAGPRTTRGGIVVSPGDFNPERIQLDDGQDAASIQMPAADTGDRLAGTVAGVLDYSFANFKILVDAAPTVVQTGPARETTTPALDDELAMASYNVENLSPADSQAKFDTLAGQIVGNLASPDLLTLEEVQDNNGTTNNGTVAADETLRLLTEAITRAGGPAYEWRQIDPVDGAEGGQPGGNIRVAFLFRTDRGLKFVDRGTPSSTEGTTVFEDRKGQPHLTRSPGRIAPQSDAWEDSRVPLAGEFKWHGQSIFAVATHFASKGGDDPLFGRWQPGKRFSEEQRHLQAEEVRAFADDLLAADPNARLAIGGDINDFDFSQTVDILVGSGATALTDLPRTLPLQERYTYVFEGNSQVLDHILLSPAWARRVRGYDVVHVNAEYADQASDHDPQVVRLTKKVQPAGS